MGKSRSERVHRWLDGESEREEFTSDELQDIRAHEDIIRETRALHQAVGAPDLSARIMSRLPVHTPSARLEPHTPNGRVEPDSGVRLRRALAWLWAPRPVRLRPAYGLAAAFATAISLIGGNPILQDGGPIGDAGIASDRIFVQFRLDAPQASTVQLAGSFTGWQPTYALQQTAPGVWSVLVPLDSGVHDYAFLVNGQWITDPIAPVVDDGFGGLNSRLLIVLPDGDSRS